LKQFYRKHCEQESTIPLFSQAWWLDAVCGESHWDVCLVENDGRVIASMPYYVLRSKGFKMLVQPVLTQCLGPWISPSSAKYAKRLSREKDLMGQLIAQLPEYHFFKQNWHYSKQNWLPFFWKGFKQTTRYTYVIENLTDLDRVMNDFSSSYRNKIRKADKLVAIERNMELEQFYKLNKMTFERQGLSQPCSFEFLAKQDRALVKQNAREIFYAIDADGAVHSALYLIWDDMSSYVHLVGEDPSLRNSGAGIRLIWEAIKFTSQVLGLDQLDFEGSMIEGVEQVRRDCGGHQKPYFSVTRTPSLLMQGGMFIKDLLR